MFGCFFNTNISFMWCAKFYTATTVLSNPRSARGVSTVEFLSYTYLLGPLHLSTEPK
jgi:hypothetical protein